MLGPVARAFIFFVPNSSDLDLTTMSNPRYLLDPKRLGLATTPDPNSLDLATISSPSVMGLERLQTQATWVWRGCQTLIIPKFWPPQWLKNQG